MKDFILILPEIFLALTLAFVVAGEISYHGEKLRLIPSTALLGLAGAFIQTILTYRYGASQAFNHSLSIDGLSLFFKLISIMIAALAIAGSLHTDEIAPKRRSEFCALVLSACLAMCFAASASDLLLAFLSLQLLNVIFYFIANYSKHSVPSTEAAVKYLMLCTVSGGFFLYGAALLFGFSHSLNLYEIHRALTASPLPRAAMLVSFVFLFFSLSFQMGGFPNYFWMPDVLQGSPTPVSGLITVAGKTTAFAVAIRLFYVVYSTPAQAASGQWVVLGLFDWPQLIAFAAGLSLLIGPLLALRQTSAKRLVGCLAIGSTGFLLLGLLVLDQVGLSALLYNLIVELFSALGAFYVLSFLGEQLGTDELPLWKGALRRAVPESVSLILFLACLVGLPPLPGFIGKFTLIGVALRHQWPVLSLIAVVSMVISTTAMTRVAYTLIGDFKKSSFEPFPKHLSRKLFLAVLLVPTALAGILANPLLEWAGRSLGFILW